MSIEYDPLFMTSGSAFTHLSDEARAAELGHIYNLITFLAMMQNCQVSLLALKWQPGLGSLGTGGTARVNQAAIHAQMSYAFKRVRTSGAAITEDVGKWVNELFILSQPAIRDHTNIICLEGCCLEMLDDGKLCPVLVFEKAPLGDLEHFISSGAAESMSFEDLVDICLEIGFALETVHSCVAMHGDVKPSNILVFPHSDGKYVVKLSDFGYASISYDGDSLLQLPYSPIWTAPDYHPRKFRIRDAQKMDIYSYSLICFWLLLGIMIDQRVKPTGHISLWNNAPMLEDLKVSGKLIEYAEETLMHNQSSLEKDRKESILKFFKLTLADKYENRSGNWNFLLCLLRDQTECPTIGVFKGFNLLWSFGVHLHRLFRIRQHIRILAKSGWRDRAGVVTQLQKSYEEGKCDLCKKSCAFELAVCSFIRFGNANSYGGHEIWLKRSGRTQSDLESELFAIRILSVAHDIKAPNDSDQFLFAVNLSRDYQGLTPTEFIILKEALVEEADSSAQAFSESSSITVDLRRALASLYSARSMFREASVIQKNLVDKLGEDPVGMKMRADLSITYVKQGLLEEAEKIRTGVVAWLQKTQRPDDSHTLSAMANLASVRNDLGRHAEAEGLLMQVVEVQKKKLGIENSMTLAALSHLAAVYHDQKRYSEAESLQLQIVQMREKSLGLDHELTWTSQLNLAAILSALGHVKEAQELELKVVGLRKKRFGLKHHLTLEALANAAMGYRMQKEWKDEESLLLQVVEGRKEVLGPLHPDTLVSMQALANNYLNQERPEAAQALLRKVVRARSLLKGKSHPSTIASLNSLARAQFDQGKRKNAEEMQLSTIEAGSKALGESHAAVLECTRHLALMYKYWGRLGDAKKLLVKVYGARKATLGPDHPDSKRVADQLQEIDLMIPQISETIKD